MDLKSNALSAVGAGALATAITLGATPDNQDVKAAVEQNTVAMRKEADARARKVDEDRAAIAADSEKTSAQLKSCTGALMARTAGDRLGEGTFVATASSLGCIEARRSFGFSEADAQAYCSENAAAYVYRAERCLKQFKFEARPQGWTPDFPEQK